MSMRTHDTEVLLKIVVGGVRYRAQRHAIQNTYCQEAKATQMKLWPWHPDQGVILLHNLDELTTVEDSNSSECNERADVAKLHLSG